MAFDVYVGTLSRYYRRDWENVAQRMAREKGLNYKTVFAGGELEPPPPADELREALADWWKALDKGLKSHRVGPVTWNEADEQPYFTDRPSASGYVALLTWAAHGEHADLPIPREVPKSLQKEPAYHRSTNTDFKSRYLTILAPELWLPTRFPFYFEFPTLNTEKTRIGSVFTLKEQLDELQAKTGAELQRQVECDEKGENAPPRKAGLLKRLLAGNESKSPDSSPSLATEALRGLSVFRDLAVKACEHELPMKLDY